MDFTASLRADERVLQGTSTRSLVLLLPALQARALMHGRDYISPDDLVALAGPVFEHRVECVPGIDAVGDVVMEHIRAQVERLAKEDLRG